MPLIGALDGGGEVPGVATSLVATAANAGATITFTPPSYIGKGTITYTATSSPGGVQVAAASSPIVFSNNLNNGTSYTFTIVGATNYGIVSAASSASNSVTPTAPAPPPPPPPPPEPPAPAPAPTPAPPPPCDTCLYPNPQSNPVYCSDLPACSGGPGPTGYRYKIVTTYGLACSPNPCTTCVCPTYVETGCDYVAFGPCV